MAKIILTWAPGHQYSKNEVRYSMLQLRFQPLTGVGRYLGGYPEKPGRRSLLLRTTWWTGPSAAFEHRVARRVSQ